MLVPNGPVNLGGDLLDVDLDDRFVIIHF